MLHVVAADINADSTADSSVVADVRGPLDIPVLFLAGMVLKTPYKSLLDFKYPSHSCFQL